MASTTLANQHARLALGGFAVIMIVWSLVWVAKAYLDQRFTELASDGAAALFWFAAKLVVWIGPACLLIRQSGRGIASEVNAAEWRRWATWGVGVGLLIAATGLARKVTHSLPLLPEKLDLATVNVLIVAPLFEEFLMRAAVLGSLVPAFGFARANLVTSLCFVALHIPGWYMMGVLTDKVTQPIGGALSIFLLGLCFGWVTRQGRSFLGGAIAHSLNNLAA